MTKKSEFLAENFQFLVVKFSIYLNRRVFVMTTERSTGATESVRKWFFQTISHLLNGLI